MKKLLVLVMCVLLCVSAFACSAQQKEPATVTEAAPAEEATTAEEPVEEKTEETPVETITLNLGACQQLEHISSKAADEFARRVYEATDGAVEIICHHAETLGVNSELAAGCAAGTVDIYFSAISQYGTYCPQETMLDAFFMFSGWDHLKRYMATEEYANLIAAVEEATTTHVLGSMYYATRNFLSKGKPIETVDDLKGMKFRVPNEPMPVACMTALGASATPVAYGECYMAMQNGTVDALENGPSSVVSMNFYEVADYYSLTAHQIQTLTYFMSDNAKNKLSEEQFALIKQICQEVSEEYSEKAVEQENADLDFLRENLTVVDVDTAPFAEICQTVWAEYASVWGEGAWEAVQDLR